MARAPIIISNGGVIGELIKDIDDPNAERKIKNNIDRMIHEDMTEAMIVIKGGSKAPCIYWRLKEDPQYDEKFESEIMKDPDRRGREGISINNLIDNT